MEIKITQERLKNSISGPLLICQGEKIHKDRISQNIKNKTFFKPGKRKMEADPCPN
jgi:hypothetical protein